MVSRWWWSLSALFYLLALVSCSDGDDGVLLRVDVVTDYVPELEFVAIEVAVEGADFSFDRAVEPDDEFLQGQRVGQLQTAGEESLILVGRLVDAGGNAIAQRRVSVPLRERTSQTLVFTRNCAEVTCPAGDPAATECQGGVCVSPDCSPENPEACGTGGGCDSAADCEAPAADCAEALCREGICLEGEIEGSCDEGEVCQPAEGCVTGPSRSDMGMPPFDGGSSDGGSGDGGMIDAFVDGGITLDFGMPECAVDADCDDGAYCNGEERCLEGMCQPAEHGVDCDDGVACTVDSCDEGTDSCVASADDSRCTAEAGGTCDDSLGCQYPTCTAATCTAGPCQTASCEGDVCVRTNLCGGSDICCGGSCVAAGCDDGNPCTDDSCGAGGCVHVNNSDPCSDGNACTVGDQCSGGSCGSGSARDCNDLNPCTNDSCNPSSGCVNTNNTNACDDGDECTVGDRCSGGSCDGGSARNCNDGNVCTSDSCNPSSGCVNTNNTVSCNDGDACTMGDRCSGGSCVGGSARDCGDSNPCTTDSCNPSTGCVNTNNTNPCSDGNACTVSDRCSGGTCAPGSPRNCNDSNPCTNDSCNVSSGCTYSNVSAGVTCAPDVCGPWSTCSGFSCMFNQGTENRTCTPRECDGLGSCIDGGSYLDSQSCTLEEGASCALCNECSSEPDVICAEAYCSGGCCIDALLD